MAPQPGSGNGRVLRAAHSFLSLCCYFFVAGCKKLVYSYRNSLDFFENPRKLWNCQMSVQQMLGWFTTKITNWPIPRNRALREKPIFRQSRNSPYFVSFSAAFTRTLDLAFSSLVFMWSHWPRGKCLCGYIGHVSSVYVITLATWSVFMWLYWPRVQCLCDHIDHLVSVYVIILYTCLVFMRSHWPHDHCLCDRICHVASVYVIV